jgi:hypothetical protein
MFKKLLILVVLVMCFSSFAKESTSFRFSLVPGFGWPKAKNVVGLNLGLIGDQEKGKTVLGNDLSLICSLTKNVKGSQTAFVSISEDSEFTQGGFVNIATSCKGTQWGFINFAKDTEGLQIGLINVMDNGWLPVFIFFNFSK